MRLRDLPAHLQPMARAALANGAAERTTPAPRPPQPPRPSPRVPPDPTPIGDPPREPDRSPAPLVLELEEPPALNVMLDLAKERRHGKPIVYAEAKRAYETRVVADVRRQGYAPPRAAWQRWRLVRAAFRLHQLRDPLELLAGLKWPIDALVGGGWLANDSPRHLRGIPDPEQVIDRANRGVSLTITPLPNEDDDDHQ